MLSSVSAPPCTRGTRWWYWIVQPPTPQTRHGPRFAAMIRCQRAGLATWRLYRRSPRASWADLGNGFASLMTDPQGLCLCVRLGSVADPDVDHRAAAIGAADHVRLLPAVA